MKKLLYLLPLVAILLGSCNQNTNDVSGKLSNNENDGKTIVLFQSNGFGDEFKPTDSTTINNGSFTIKRTETNNPSMAYLVIKDAIGNIPDVLPFVYENGQVKITVDSLVNLKGTPTNDSYQKFIVEMRDIDKQLYALENSTNTNIEEYKKIDEKQTEIVYNFIKSNIKTSFGEFLFITYASFLDINQLKTLVNETSPSLQAKLKPFLESGGESGQGNFIGKQYINVSGDSPDNKKIALSDYIGKNKIVLIDFWASWCGPCIQEMPNVVEAYKLFKDKGFEIVGISLDQDRAEWLAAIKQLDMTWPQMSDLKGWDSELSKAYNIQSIPFTLLVNEKGEIIGENLRGNELINKLSELLK